MSFAPAGTTLIERLGVGSVFEVGVVRDGEGREILAKRLSPSAVGLAGNTALLRERDMLTLLKGARVPELLRWGDDESGPFLLESRASGSAARGWIDGPARPSAGHWLALARSAFGALAELHAWSDSGGPLVASHGDVSPDNLFFTQQGGATFIDWSSATWRGDPAPAFARDRGTVPYAAPEVVRGEARASQATDVYALAATLLAVAVGSITHSTTEASMLLEVGTEGVRTERIDERRDLSPRVRMAMAAALELERARRLCSASELAERLRAG